MRKECNYMKRLTYELVKEFIEGLGYELIDKECIKYYSKLTIKDKDGFYYHVLFKHIKNGHIPNKFYNSNPYSIQNIKTWCILNNKPFEILENKFIDARHHKYKWKCFKEDCQEVFEMTWSHVHRGCGCPYCCGKKLGLSNCLATKNPDLAAEWHPTKNGELTPHNVTVNSGKKIWWKCKDCEHEWYTKIYHRSSGSGCPMCNFSKGENRIKEYLDLNIVRYISQKEFKGLVGVGDGNLSYDFYLPEHNMLIEYQGGQHEQYIPYFHKNKTNFKKQQQYDMLKKEYAKQNNINLLEIWHYDFNNIEIILKKELNI